jgi:hypothetical protein
MSDNDDLARAVELYAELGRQLAKAGDVGTALQVVTSRSIELIPGAQAASITQGRHGRFETIAPTDALPPAVDHIQYELGTGPCVDAILDDTVYRADDLRTDDRWPHFGKRAAEETGVLSMLAVRMYFEDDDLIAGLNLYSREASAFDRVSEITALAVASQGMLSLTGVERLEEIANLRRALDTNREIGAASGILMATYKLTQDQAFDLLRMASQRGHRKLAEVARGVVETGTLELGRDGQR